MATKDPFDLPLERGATERNDVDRASLDATERLRARLTGQPLPRPRQAPRSSLPWVIAGGLFVFTMGMIANPWFEAAVRDRLPFAEALGPRAAEDADVAAMQARIAALERRVTTAPAPAERLARTEAKIETSSDQLAREAERVDRLTAELGALSAAVTADRARGDAAATLATTTATRAESLLALLLTRRALAEGRALGALDAEIRRLFEARFPKAVTAIAALGTAPVTRAALARDFAALRPGLAARPDAGARLGWWAA
ncbi:hypothetical protein IP88_11395, partial [alpha proteobacterium AAP81b]